MSDLIGVDGEKRVAEDLIHEDLNRYTPARVSLGRVGVSLPTGPLLDFQLAHAQARDAVHARMAVQSLVESIRGMGLETLTLKSAAGDRAVYLKRPDLGRRLDESSAERVEAVGRERGECELAIVIGDGLSALAVDRQAVPLLEALLPMLEPGGWRLGPVCVVEQARVAVGDAIGERLLAEVTLMLVGERPGLSSPDSLGAYVTWAPRAGRTDAERNCISNIRPEGLGFGAAAMQIAHYLNEARRLKLTGVSLKGMTVEAQAIFNRLAKRAEKPGS